LPPNWDDHTSLALRLTSLSLLCCAKEQTIEEARPQFCKNIIPWEHLSQRTQRCWPIRYAVVPREGSLLDGGTSSFSVIAGENLSTLRLFSSNVVVFASTHLTVIPFLLNAQIVDGYSN
jgi:hypothetical protein